MLSQFNISLKFYITLFISIYIITFLTYTYDGSFLSLFSAINAVLYVFFAGAGKVVCFIFGILYSLSYAYIAYELKLYGDVMLNLFYLPINIYGIYHWKNNQNKEKTRIIIRKLDNIKRIYYGIFLIFASLIYAYILKNMNASFIYLNSFAIMGQLIAFYMQVKRYMESYFIVTLANIASLIIWFLLFEQNQENIAQLLNTFIFLIIGIYYFFVWKKQTS
ncbi:nicotinamide riboside transporter PnuC [Campylobacter lari]|uniref:nicotinamide riboside transporter PnuC n=1 Tax=Campylobacter lari TaxID=201 RepID=UPI001C7D5B21|nr:nicotinamide riboside transporter PnuC [Campylobacter lari]MBX2683230.1 nicotinamide mononucleotide transporter [Campylobacter lari]MCW0228724.1 nicotinamide riboside transporter PnuC [Campylobacter lari]